jgi:hypothetical protein
MTFGDQPRYCGWCDFQSYCAKSSINGIYRGRMIVNINTTLCVTASVMHASINVMAPFRYYGLYSCSLKLTLVGRYLWTVYYIGLCYAVEILSCSRWENTNIQFLNWFVRYSWLSWCNRLRVKPVQGKNSDELEMCMVAQAIKLKLQQSSQSCFNG